MNRYVLWLVCVFIVLIIASLYVGSKDMISGVAFGLASISLIFAIMGFGVTNKLSRRFLGFVVFPGLVGVVGFRLFGEGSSLLSLVYLVGGLSASLGLFVLWLWGMASGVEVSVPPAR